MDMKPQRNAPDARYGLTLLELVVVLVILAIVATVAVQSLQPRVDSARASTTRQALEQLSKSIIGQRDMRQADGTPLLQGFIVDVGRNPKLSLQSEFPPLNRSPAETGTPDELWNPECALARDFPYSFRPGPKSPVDYSDVRLPCGWRGPYLQLPVGAKRLTDGWGRAFKFESNSLQEISLAHAETIPSMPGESVQQKLDGGRVVVTGTVVAAPDIDASATKVVLLVPDPSQSLDELAVLENEDAEPLFFQFSDVPVGLRTLVVTVGNERIAKYVYVPHSGLSLVLDARPPVNSGTHSDYAGEVP